MRIVSRAQGFELSSAIDTFVRDQLSTALGRFSEEVGSVDVFLADVNGPKGGIDKQVLVRVQIRGRRQITLQTTNTNLYAAIRISAKRAKRAVRRSLRKAGRFNKVSLRRLVTESSGSEVTGT